MTSFYNSGLYVKPFFKTHHEHEAILDYGDISFNTELFADYHKDLWDYKNKDDLLDAVHDSFYEYLSYYDVFFEPQIFNEEIAYECGLTPFTVDEKLNLLALSGTGMNLSPRLDAYQTLTCYTIDVLSLYFTDVAYFRYVVGDKIMQKISKIITL